MSTIPPEKIAFLDPRNPFTRNLTKRSELREDCEAVDIYELPETDLDPYAGMIVSSQADQEFLLDHAARIEAFLEAGRVVTFSGHLSTPWLPGAAPFVEKPIASHRDYRVKQVREHPVFEGVSDEDLTLQKGVAGFFARGHHPPPSEAKVLVRFADGEPVVYVDEATTEGTILVHSGNDLVGFGRRPSTASRIPGQLVDWMQRQAREVR